jgi:hypothetical protein
MTLEKELTRESKEDIFSKASNYFVRELKSQIYWADSITGNFPSRAASYMSNVFKSRSYWVDTSAGATFWTPVMAANEFYHGMNSLEIAKARSLGLLIGATINRPVLKLRDYWAKNIWKIQKSSSQHDILRTLKVCPSGKSPSASAVSIE